MRSSVSPRASGRRDPAAGRRLIRVVLALRARLDREGLAALLGAYTGFRVVGRAGTHGRALELCARLRPGVVILDPLIGWPGGSIGVAEVLAVAPRARILVLAPHLSDRCAILNPPCAPVRDGAEEPAEPANCLGRALREGAHGVLRRDCGSKELALVVRTLARGGRWIGSDVSFRDSEGAPLSDRERHVARLVGQGFSNKNIAEALGISELTVKKHLTKVLRKLGLENRLQLGLFVARHSTRFSDLAPVP